jgi:undecaprenyl-diphosphatase
MFDRDFGFNKKTYSYMFMLVLILLAILAIVAVYAMMSSIDKTALEARGHVDLFDASITHFLNQFSTLNPAFDSLVVELSGNELIKGGFTVGLILYLWFSCDDSEDQRRGSLMATILFAIVGVIFVRLMTHFLPFRTRPLHVPQLNFVLPVGMSPLALINWSSFPSDHATLFFSLATGIYLISRRWGVVALLHALIIVCLPRLYLGIHWSTDLLAGGIIGVFMALLGNTPFIRRSVHRMILSIARYNRALFYTGFFLLNYEVVTLFDDIRHIIVLIIHIFRGHF